MTAYHIKRALEIFRKEGPVELVERSIQFYYEKLTAEWKYTESDGRDEIYTHPENIEYYLIEGDHPATSHRQIKEYANRHKLEKAFFKPKIFKGKVLDGSWDNYKESYQYDRVYRGLKAIFAEDKDWENTHLGHRSLLKEKTQALDHSEYVQGVNLLYRSMSEDGFIKSKSASPLRINIGRNGELIFNNNDGHKRIAIAKLTKVNKIPVEVIVRHKQWQELRDDVYKNGLPDEYEKLRNHPDLQDILN